MITVCYLTIAGILCCYGGGVAADDLNYILWIDHKDGRVRVGNF